MLEINSMPPVTAL